MASKQRGGGTLAVPPLLEDSDVGLAVGRDPSAPVDGHEAEVFQEAGGGGVIVICCGPQGGCVEARAGPTGDGFGALASVALALPGRADLHGSQPRMAIVGVLSQRVNVGHDVAGGPFSGDEEVPGRIGQGDGHISFQPGEVVGADLAAAALGAGQPVPVCQPDLQHALQVAFLDGGELQIVGGESDRHTSEARSDGTLRGCCAVTGPTWKQTLATW